MKKIKRCIKQMDYRHYICFGFVCISITLTVLCFRDVFARMWEGCRDIGTSAKYYVSELFELNLSGRITVNEFSSVELKMPFNLPETWDLFKKAWKAYWQLIITKDNITAYITALGNVLYYLSKVLLIVLPFISVFFVLKIFGSDKQNNDYGKRSKPLRRWLALERKVIYPVKHWLAEFRQFGKKNAFWKKIIIFVWVVNFNFITMALEVIAYYLFFASSFEVITLYRQVLKLLLDLSFITNFLPSAVWVLLALWFVNKIRRNIGYGNLEHMEMKNRGFTNERPICLMICGTMGKRKTTTLTDMALSQEIMFRDKAFEKLLNADLKFPYFPWLNLELSIKQSMDNHTVYNLATCKRFVRSKLLKFGRKPCRQNIFMYDYNKYGMLYNDGLTVKNVWEIIEDYTQLYFIYVIQSSLLISNYSVRVDGVLNDLGNFPLWNSDLFRKDSRLSEAYSRHAHILDFDTLRLGKKVVENNANADSFEFGCVLITEIGKERKNSLELQGMKKLEESANQKNDLFNDWLKMIRHSATVDNFPFVKVITDEQRPESWGADARDLCEIVYIDESSDMKLAMPLFALEDLVLSSVLSKHKGNYYSYRFNRADTTLLHYLSHAIVGKLYTYRLRIYNTFGFYQLAMQVESGRMDGNTKARKYFIMSKKVYSKRYSTDCFSDFFVRKSMKAPEGINDLAEYATEKATLEELQQQNSYFINDLTHKLG